MQDFHALTAYQPQLSDELEIQVNDAIIVEHTYMDGYLFIKFFNNGSRLYPQMGTRLEQTESDEGRFSTGLFGLFESKSPTQISNSNVVDQHFNP